MCEIEQWTEVRIAESSFPLVPTAGPSRKREGLTFCVSVCKGRKYTA